MEQKAHRFLIKENIKPTDILYFVRHDRKTVLYLIDGTQRETYLPVKYLLAALPDHQFLNITKGVVISTSAIYEIEGSVYTMVDGRQFIGRKRGAGEHRLNRHLLETGFEQQPLLSQTIAQQFSILDRSPMACCVVQLLTNTAGHTVDFVFRYCNQAMLNWEDCQEEELLDHSFYDLHQHWNHRWLAIYTDVALNGASRVVTEFDQKHQCPVTVFCYQPMDSYCVCCLISGTISHDTFFES